MSRQSSRPRDHPGIPYVFEQCAALFRRDGHLQQGRHIVPSVQSVLRQTLQDFELLIVGDGCTDNTEAAIRPFLSDRVSFRNQAVHSGSQSAPNNLGVAAARGMNVAFIGHDDIWSADHLASLQALFAIDPGLHFA